ncbi:MAG: DUF2726 domain-containing protein [Planktotalea sp.]|uniref:DUF2726 domain-containing protein n=1 Tax=Planktotalea sp. TaxID=2029877 RepID=UPI003C78A8E9
MLRQNPEYLFYGVGGIVALLFALKILKKRKKTHPTNVALVMPAPYTGANEDDQASDESPSMQADPKDHASIDAIPQLQPRQLAKPQTRSLAQQLDDVSAISFSARTAMTADEARMRVLVQSVINEFGAGYMVMARTALAALLEPGREAVGPERANAIAAIENKYLDFAVFDRAGRCLLTLDVATTTPPIGNKAIERAVVFSALGQAGLPVAKLLKTDTAADVRSKIASYLKPIAQGQTPSKQNSAIKPRPGRPTRPMRPAHAAAVAAE